MSKSAMITNQLRAAIQQSGLSNYRLSKLAGVAQPIIDRFVDNDRDIRLATAERLAFSLGLEFTNQSQPNEFYYFPTGKIFINTIEAAKTRVEKILKSASKKTK